MRRTTFTVAVAVAVLAALAPAAGTSAAELYGLSPGPIELQSAGPIAFGPDNVLFVGDPKAAKIYAINTDDRGERSTTEYNVKDLSGRLSSTFGGDAVSVADLAVNPATGNTFLSLTAGDRPALARVTATGEVTPLNLDKIGHAVAVLPNPPEDKTVQRGRRSQNARELSITDIAYTDGRLLVAGLSANDSPSTVREFDFPFRAESAGVQVEIYHAAHGKREDYAPIQTFVPFNIGGEPSLLAGYTCTPLVKMPIAKIKSDSKITGTTVAELGNWNKPLDMIVYHKDGKDFLLLANTNRGVMKISTDDLERETGLSERVERGGTAGQSYETIESLTDVVQLDKLDESRALVMVQPEEGPASLRSVALP